MLPNLCVDLKTIFLFTIALQIITPISAGTSSVTKAKAKLGTSVTTKFTRESITSIEKPPIASAWEKKSGKYDDAGVTFPPIKFKPPAKVATALNKLNLLGSLRRFKSAFSRISNAFTKKNSSWVSEGRYMDGWMEGAMVPMTFLLMAAFIMDILQRLFPLPYATFVAQAYGRNPVAAVAATAKPPADLTKVQLNTPLGNFGFQTNDNDGFNLFGRSQQGNPQIVPSSYNGNSYTSNTDNGNSYISNTDNGNSYTTSNNNGNSYTTSNNNGISYTTSNNNGISYATTNDDPIINYYVNSILVANQSQPETEATSYGIPIVETQGSRYNGYLPGPGPIPGASDFGDHRNPGSSNTGSGPITNGEIQHGGYYGYNEDLKTTSGASGSTQTTGSNDPLTGASELDLFRELETNRGLEPFKQDLSSTLLTSSLNDVNEIPLDNLELLNYYNQLDEDVKSLWSRHKRSSTNDR